MAPPLVLSCKVFAAADAFPVPERPASRPLGCVSRRAIGVSYSDDADKAVRELRFDTHLADAPAMSRLTLSQEEGIRHVSVLAIDYKLIVLGSRLPSTSCHSPPVYIVYDAVEQSITMIPSYPWSRIPQPPGEMRETASPMGPLIAPRAPGGDGRQYALVTMNQTTIYSRDKDRKSVVHKHDLVYIWRSWLSPAPRWDMVTAVFPAEFKGDHVSHSYINVLTFSCSGLAFWVNLLRGAMYCSLDALLSASDAVSSKFLEFRFISLPVKLPPEIPANLMCAYEMFSRMFRTMGRAGKSSIKFVTIDGFLQHLDFVDCTLMVWSLSPEISLTKWTKRSLCLGTLVDQDSFREACLPTDLVPMYPSLNPGEGNVIYFMLGKYEMCCNMHTKSKERCNGHVTTAEKPLYQLRVDMSQGLLLGAARLPEKASPSVILADASVLPTQMIHGESTLGRKLKRRRGRGAVLHN